MFLIIPKSMVESVVKFTDTLQDIKTHNPDFILDTGDLVESNNLDFFLPMPRYISSETTPTLNRSTFTLSVADFVAEPEHIWGISVRDSLGRHTGMNWTTGGIEREIPGSYYTGHYNKPPSDTPQVLVVYPSDNSLEVVYHALEYGDGTTLVTKEPDVYVQKLVDF